MATRFLARSLHASKPSLSTAFSNSGAAAASSVTSSFPSCLRPLAAAASASYLRRYLPALSARAFSTQQASSSLNDPNPNWSNRPPKETILLDGCDFEHWLVVVEKPEGEPTREEIIDSYIKTLATVVGSEEEARMKIYSVSTRHYYAFGALVNEELSYKLKELPKVRWVLPDSYLDVRNKDYGGEPFINGQAVPYDPKYHEEWVRNNSRANERNRRNDRPRNFDRSRNFERREIQGPPGGPGGNHGGPPGGPGGNYGGPPAGPGGNYGGPPGGPGGNYGGPPGGPGNNMRPPANYQNGPGPNQGGFPTGPGPNAGGSPYANQNQNQNYPGPNTGNFAPNAGYGPGPTQNNFGPNAGAGPGQYQNAYGPSGGSPPHFPPPPKY